MGTIAAAGWRWQAGNLRTDFRPRNHFIANFESQIQALACPRPAIDDPGDALWILEVAGPQNELPVNAPLSGIAVYGGAFDPPHRSHRRICAAAVDQLPVERLLVLPAGDHPFKRGAQLAAGAHRLAMCRLAFAGLSKVHIDDRELRRSGVSFTVDTLQAIANEFPGRPIWFVIGADNLRQLPTWRDHHRILQLARIATIPRVGWDRDEKALDGLDLTPEERASLLAGMLRTEPDSVTATDVRLRLARGERGIAELDESVEAYAVAHDLYRA